MNVAVILAGGSGSRVGAAVPKQFIEVVGKPVLAYTINRFDNHPEIDAIEIVIRAGWEDYLSDVVAREGFSKVCWIAPAGEDFQHSVINGIKRLEDKVTSDDVILIHYGASPMVPDDVISDAIRVCGLYGNASPAHSQVYLAAERQDGKSTTGFMDRNQVMVLNSPQALRYGYAKWLYDEAEQRDLLETTEPHTTSLMLAMGERIWFSKDSTSNIKITTPEDLKLFHGWVLAEKMQT